MKLKRSGIITKIIVFAIVIYTLAGLLSMRGKIETVTQSQAELKRQVAEKELSNAELEYEISHSTDDDVLAKIARTNFGLVMPGEIVFYDSVASGGTD